MSFEQLAPFILIGLFLLHVIVMHVFFRADVKLAVYGEDGQPQLIEMAGYIMLLLVILLIILDVGFGMKASSHAHFTIDWILSALLLGKVTNDHLKRPKTQNSNDQTSNF